MATVYIEDDIIYLDLPYSLTGFDTIEQFTTKAIAKRLFNHGKNTNTNVYYDTEKRQWCFSLTEVNLLFIKEFLEELNFKDPNISSDVSEMLEQIETIIENESDHIVELCVDNDLKPYIRNGSEALLEYLEKEEITDLWDLIDKSGELGYSLSSKVRLMLNDSVEHIMVSNSRVSLTGTVKEKEKKLKHMILYALKYNRLPMVFYSPERYTFGPKIDKGIATEHEARPVTKHEKLIDPKFDPMVFKVIRQFIKDESVIKAIRGCRKDCLVYHAHNVQNLIESEINPQLIFFTRLINEKTFSIFLDQIPKVCYYNTLNYSVTEDDKNILQQLGPLGHSYYAKV